MSKKTIKKVVEVKMLTENQCEVIKAMIIGSMRDVYIDMGSLPGDGFEPSASLIADKIIKNAQMALMQGETFAKIAKKK